MRICFWGTYDTGKPRIRVLLAGLRESGCIVTERHVNVWQNVNDKSQIKSRWLIARLILSVIFAYPVLFVRHAFSGRNDVVVCGYPGNLDILVLWVLAKLRGERIALDAFIPLHDTLVMDRKMLASRKLPARLLHALEGLSYRCADMIIVDTHAHGEYFISEFGVKPGRVIRALVGVEPALFHAGERRREARTGASPVVLFYGQFIPLHGIGTIIEAARLCTTDSIWWRIIGTGQGAQRITDILRDAPLANLEWIPWVDYEKLRDEIEQAAVCLGIFGTSMKAARVIPNKVFQITACGKPLITRDSPAIRELFSAMTPGVWLIPPGDPAALCAAVRKAITGRRFYDHPDDILDSMKPGRIGKQLAEDFERAIAP